MNKLNKGKTIGLVSLGLAAVSLAGVGFSTWVISGNTTGETGQVTVEVADVSDQRIEIKDAKVDDGKISYDADGNGTLIKSAGTTNLEDLNFSVSFSVVAQKDAVFAGVKAYIKPVNSVQFNAALNANFIALPANVFADETSMSKGNAFVIPVGQYEQKDISVDSNTGAKTYAEKTIEFEMKWGTAFNQHNPTALTEKANLDTYITNLKTLKSYNLSFALVLYPCVVTA